MHTGEAGGFLKQIDEIKNELENRHVKDNIIDNREVDAWQDDVSERGEDREEVSDCEQVPNNEVRKLLNEHKGEDGSWSHYALNCRESGLVPDGVSIELLERLVSILKYPHDDGLSEAVSICNELKDCHMHNTRAYKRLSDQIDRYKDIELKIKEINDKMESDQPADKSSLKLKNLLSRTKNRVGLEVVQSVIKNYSRYSEIPLFDSLKDRIGRK